MTFANDIVKEMNERGTVEVPEGCVTGEAFEEWLANDLSKHMNFTKEQREYIKVYVILKRKEAKAEVIDRIMANLKYDFKYVNKDSKVAVYFITKYMDILEKLKEQNNEASNMPDNS